MFVQVIQGRTLQPLALLDAPKASGHRGTARSRLTGLSRALSKVKEPDPC
jgi:hypothetical protein